MPTERRLIERVEKVRAKAKFHPHEEIFEKKYVGWRNMCALNQNMNGSFVWGGDFQLYVRNRQNAQKWKEKMKTRLGVKKIKKMNWEMSDSKECKPLIKTPVSSQALSFPFCFVVKIIEGCWKKCWHARLNNTRIRLWSTDIWHF